MPLPTETEWQQHVSNNILSLDSTAINHPAFTKLLKAIRASAITIANPVIEAGEGYIEALGQSSFLGSELHEALLTAWDKPGAAGEFHVSWYGNLHGLTLAQLNAANALPSTFLKELGTFAEVEFPVVAFAYESSSESLQFEVKTSDFAIQPGGVAVELSNAGFRASVYLTEPARVDLMLFGKLKVGSSVLAARFEIPGNLPGKPVNWRFTLSEPFILKNGLEDIVAYLGGFPGVTNAVGQDFSALLPEAIRQLPTIGVSEFDLIVAPGSGTLILLQFGLDTQKPFELLPNLVINNIGMHLSSFRNGPEMATTITLHGSVSLAEAVHAAIEIQIPLNKTSNWVISLDGRVEVATLQQLENFPFISIADLQLPPEWLEVDEVSLDELEFEFNPIQATVTRASLELTLLAQSTLVPGITVRNPTLQFELQFS